jgi:hypothetical protein
MYIKNGSVLMAFALISAFVIATAGKNQEPTQAERVVRDNPEVILLELTPITRRRSAGVYEKVLKPFKPGSNITFELMGTNTSILPLVVYGWNTISQNRPMLFRDGQEVPYRKGLAESLKRTEKEPMEVIHLVTTRLEPNQPKLIEKLDLGNWYEPLAVGHFQLTVRHRFVDSGKWVESTSITFELEPNSK